MSNDKEPFPKALGEHTGDLGLSILDSIKPYLEIHYGLIVPTYEPANKGNQ